MNNCPNIDKLLNIMVMQGYISNPAKSVMKEFLLDKFKMINDIRTNDIAVICEEIRKFQGSNEVLGDEWLTGEFNDKSPEIIAIIAVVEVLMVKDVKSHSHVNALKLLTLIHERVKFRRSN
jgi:hypothetical protein